MHKVLIVDDERLERVALKKLIQANFRSFEVIGEAKTVEEAITLAVEKKPQIILMDSQLHGRSPMEVVEIVEKLTQHVRFIFLAEYPYRADFSEHTLILEKPILLEELTARLQEAVQGSTDRLNDLLDQLFESMSAEDYKGSKQYLSEYIELARQTTMSSEKMKSHIQTFIEKMLRLYEQKHIVLPELSKNIFDCLSVGQAERVYYSLMDDLFSKLIESNVNEEKRRIQSALNYIEKNYQQGVTLEEVAEHVHLSPHYLSRLFKKELKVNFVTYVSERRIEYAKELLEKTDLPVINIALELNYHEPNYFSKVFKKSTGMTPSEYRKKLSQSPDLLKRNYFIPNGNWYI